MIGPLGKRVQFYIVNPLPLEEFSSCMRSLQLYAIKYSKSGHILIDLILTLYFLL